MVALGMGGNFLTVGGKTFAIGAEALKGRGFEPRLYIGSKRLRRGWEAAPFQIPDAESSSASWSVKGLKIGEVGAILLGWNCCCLSASGKFMALGLSDAVLANLV